MLFPTKQSPVLRDVSVEKEIASPPKTKSGGSQRHNLARCTVANFKLKYWIFWEISRGLYKYLLASPLQKFRVCYLN